MSNMIFMKRSEITLYFLTLLMVLSISILLGYKAAENNPQMAKTFVDQFTSEFGFIKLLPPILIFLIIFINNSVKAFLAMILGIFFGLAPLFFVFVNGYMIGVVVYFVGSKIGIGRVVMMLLPHGVIEIPAIILACSYGMWLGRMFLKKITGSDVSIGNCMELAIRYYLKTVIPMLIVAAFVETFITPHLS